MSSTSWWAAKLAGDQPAPVRPTPAPRLPSHAQMPSLPYVPQVTRQPENLSEALAMGVPTKGGDGARAGENSNCPMCGSGHFLTMRGVMDDKGNRGPAPRCFSCGYTQHLPAQGAPPV